MHACHDHPNNARPLKPQNKQYPTESKPAAPKTVKTTLSQKKPGHALFRSTLAVAVVDPAVAAAAALGAGAFFVVAPVTPFLMLPITVRLAAACVTGGLGCAPGGAVMGRFLITVEVLPSLDSLVPLVLRAVRVAGLAGGFAAAALTVAARFLLAAAVAAAAAAAPVPVVELLAVVLDVIVLRVPVAVGGREVVDLLPSTILLSMLLAAAALPGVGAGRAMPDLAGVVAVRGAMREFEVVGESTCAGLRTTLAGAWGRNFFCGVWASFSLSPPEISWLFHVLAHCIFCSKSERPTSVSCLPSAR
jgi:hypothetical protein